jgi:quercetin dioxygenase-like cupin family protein
MLPFVGPEFIAHFLNGPPNGGHRTGIPPAPRMRSNTFGKPKFLLKVRRAFIEITQPAKIKGRNEMGIQTSSLNAFSVAPEQGRSPKPLNILGSDVLVKLANADTNGTVAVFQHPVPPMGGPPLHRHSREDEWFYVLDGEITVEVDGERMVLPAGGSAFAPRSTVHAFQNFGTTQARILVMVTPGGFHQFFEKLSALSSQDPARLDQIAKEYGIEILGPPLS